MKRSRFILFTLLSLLPALLFILLLEGALRIYRRHSAGQWQDSPEWRASAAIHRKSENDDLIYELNPGAKAVRENVEIAINDDGFRDDPFGESGADRFGIIVLGDSVAFGWGVEMEKAFPFLLEERLNAEVYNLAVDGYALKQEIAMLRDRGLDFGPDFVLLNYTLNDPDLADGGLGRYFRRPPSELIHLISRAHYKARFKLYRIFEKKDYHHFVHDYHRDEIIRSFAELGEISRESGVPVTVAVNPVFGALSGGNPHEDIFRFIEKLCDKNNLGFIDLSPPFTDQDPDETAFDIWHPTPPGHKIIAEYLAENIRMSAVRGLP